MPFEHKRYIKSHINKLAIAIFVYELILQVLGSVLVVFGTDLFQDSAFAMIVSGIFALLITYLILGTPETAADMGHKRFTPLTYLWMVLMMYGLQFICSYLSLPIEELVHSLGHSLEGATEAAVGSDYQSTAALLYSILFAPLFEELLFRYFVFGELRKFGRVFAVGTSALLFGLMHGNLIQLPVALGIGILFAIVREQYGLRYSLLLHITNNSLALFFNHYTKEYALLSLLYQLMLLGGSALVALTLLRFLPRIYQAIREEPSLPRCLLYFFTSICMVIVLLSFIALTLLNLD